MQNTKNTNECINWIEEAISKEYFRLYEHKYFSNVQRIGTGGFGKVYRANWKNSEQYLALKYFFNLDDVTAKEIVHELKLQRDIQFHNNIIKFYGVAQFEPENQYVQSKNYLLVMEYADSVHRDLHSGNVLVHQNTIKLSDFGGQPPFATEEYDIDLALEISQGRREEPIPNTPESYIKIYTECWDIEPDNRPTINQVLERLKAFITKTTENHQTESNLQSTSTDGQNFNPINIDTSNINNSLHGEMSQIIENFDKINTKEMKAVNLFIKVSEQDHALAKYYVGLCYQFGRGTVVDEKLAFEYYEKIANKGHAIGLFKCGYFYHNGIGISVNYQKAFELYQQAANLGDSTAQNNLGVMYENGIGISVNYQKAFELYQQAANLGDSAAQNNLGVMYENGNGVNKDHDKAFKLYHKAANSGNSEAQYNLANMEKELKRI
ncbi:kinase-like domain-containing protein [Rhizophagus irregularis DAOM 181602=DAOM 197198]|nr:kinase-like domain-containing protein [Rhizophagus irregularis DAOM 181602=DAOM 197198]